MTNKLPQGWVECKMKDVLEFSQGIQVDVNLQQYSKFSDEYIRFLRIVDFTQKTEPPRYVLNPPTHVIVTDDDISMVRYGAAGFVCTGLNGAIANNLFRIIPKENIFNNRFLYYFLIGDSFQNYIKHKQTGTTMQAISFKIMNEADIVVPPLNEQKRIVEKIEEEFGKIDEGLEKLKLAQEQIKQYRQSVLKAAFDGKLYKTTEWDKYAIKEVSTNIQYGYTESASSDRIGPKFLRITDIQNNSVNWDKVPYCRISDENKSKYLLKNEDFVFARTGATVGKSYMIQDLHEEAVYASYLIRIGFKDNIETKFIKYYFQTNEYWAQIADNQVGIGQPNVNGTKLGNLTINLPTIEEQKQIVKEIEKRFEVTDKAERVITENLEKAEQLKQSILKKAFEGRLVPQDPKDEPSSELLAKIKAERESK